MQQNLKNRRNMKIWVNGCFDILHVGHIKLLKHAKSLGDYLIVGLDTDERVKQLKGDLRPINNVNDRKIMMESIRWVDEVVIFNTDEELTNLIRINNIGSIVVGSEYKNKRVIGGELTKVTFFDRIGDYSTSNIILSVNNEQDTINWRIM